MILKSCNISSIMSNTFSLVHEVGGDIFYRAVVEQDFDFLNLFFCCTFTFGMIFTVGVAGLLFCCEGLVFVWIIRAVTAKFAEYFIPDMVLVHSREDWRVLLSMAFPSTVTMVGWDLCSMVGDPSAVNRVGWVLTVGISAVGGISFPFGVEFPDFVRCLYRLLVSRLIPAGGNLGPLFNSF